MSSSVTYPPPATLTRVPFIRGDEVIMKLHRPFWTELSSRYGNLFYTRQEVRSMVCMQGGDSWGDRIVSGDDSGGDRRNGE